MNFPSGLHVLVVDDDGPTLKVVSTMLQKCSYQGMTCSGWQHGHCSSGSCLVSTELALLVTQSPPPRVGKKLSGFCETRHGRTTT